MSSVPNRIYFQRVLEDPEPVVIQCRHVIENEFMTPETTAKLAEILITKYMRLTEDDLEEWDSNPEGWALEEEADSWKYQVRVSRQEGLMDPDESLILRPDTNVDVHGNLLIYLAMRRESVHGSVVQSTRAIESSPCPASRNNSAYVLIGIAINYHCSKVVGSNIYDGLCRDVGHLPQRFYLLCNWTRLARLVWLRRF